MSVRQWIQHAFAVDPGVPTPAGKDGSGSEPNRDESVPDAERLSASERQIVDQVCIEVVRRRLATPALAFLEMSRPLNYLGSQTMHFFAPIVTGLVGGEGYSIFAKFLERRSAIDILCARIEQLERDAERRPENTSPGHQEDDCPAQNSSQCDS